MIEIEEQEIDATFGCDGGVFMKHAAGRRSLYAEDLKQITRETEQDSDNYLHQYYVLIPDLGSGSHHSQFALVPTLHTGHLHSLSPRVVCLIVQYITCPPSRVSYNFLPSFLPSFLPFTSGFSRTTERVFLPYEKKEAWEVELRI